MGFLCVDLFVFCVVFWFVYGVLGSVWLWFGALSMLLKRTFYVVKSVCSAGYECDVRAAWAP